MRMQRYPFCIVSLEARHNFSDDGDGFCAAAAYKVKVMTVPYFFVFDLDWQRVRLLSLLIMGVRLCTGVA